MPALGHAVLSRIWPRTLSTRVNRVFRVGGELANLHDAKLHQEFTATPAAPHSAPLSLRP
jgi:hypothetical protein